MPTGKKMKAERDYRDFMKCELCEFGYLENYEDDEPISVEEYGTDGYPDR